MARTRGRKPSGDTDRQIPHVQVLERALSILETLAQAEKGYGLVEVANRTDLHPSTAYRLLATLVNHGFVSHDEETGHYRIGLKAFEVGSAFRLPHELRELGASVLRALMQLTGETANLAVLERGEVTYIQQVESPSLVGMHARTGRRVPAHCTGAGKVLLAGLTEEEIDHVIAEHGLTRLTPHTIVDRARLLRAVEEIRQQGYALDDEEIEEGVRCVAAPVFDEKKHLVAALSITGPVTRFNGERLPALIGAVRAAAAELSGKLGFRNGGGSEGAGARVS